MMTSERWLLQSLAISVTASRMLPRSRAWTPQSIRIWLAPTLLGTLSRKKSPKPTRYMRTRKPLAAFTNARLCDGVASGAEIGFLCAVPLSRCGDRLDACPARAAFDWVLDGILAMVSPPRAAA